MLNKCNLLMPEGPEISRTTDTLNKTIKDKTITDLSFTIDELKDYENKLTGKKVTGVEARGKAILTFFEGTLAMYSHNQLYGLWKVSDNGIEPDTNRSLRVTIRNDEGAAFLYSATQIEMLDKSDISNHSYLKKLGPDVLHPDTTYEDIIGQYRSYSFKNRKLTTLLLDQGFVSGIGNYLRSEIMFYAGVSPNLKLREYSDEEKKRLARATVKLSNRSYETGGITNDPPIVEALKREGASRPDYRHFVYNRTDDRCHKCGRVIEE